MNMLLKADHIDSNFDKGVSCIDSGNYQLAIAYFDEVVKDAPHNVGAYANRSTALIGLGDYWEALRDLERAITIDPGDPQLRRNRGILLKDYPTPPVDLFDIPDRTDFGPLNRYPLETFNKEGVSSVDLGEHSKRGMGLPKLMDVPLDKPESD
jgi:tetratricopeptide (TPR) repeat protein